MTAPAELKRGDRFGELTVLERSASTRSGKATWRCICDCGNETVTTTGQLRSGNTKSCGCRVGRLCAERNYVHGEGARSLRSGGYMGSKPCRYEMWTGAKKSARRKGLPFNLELSDIVIPERCPVLDIPLKPEGNRRGRCDDSPSLDRMVPELGYVKGNICVISWRANTLKRDATPDELRRVAEYTAAVQHPSAVACRQQRTTT